MQTKYPLLTAIILFTCNLLFDQIDQQVLNYPINKFLKLTSKNPKP